MGRASGERGGGGGVKRKRERAYPWEIRGGGLFVLMDEFISDKQVISANCRQSYGGQATPCFRDAFHRCLARRVVLLVSVGDPVRNSQPF